MAIENKILTFGSNKVATVGGNKLMGFAPFLPTSIDGCICWLENDSDSMIFNGANVAQWTDKSGSNNHAIENTASNQLIYDTSEGGIFIPNSGGGKLTIDFGETILRPHTIIAIASQNSGSATFPRLMDFNTASDTLSGDFQFTGSHTLYRRGLSPNVKSRSLGFDKICFYIENPTTVSQCMYYENNVLEFGPFNAGEDNFQKIIIGNRFEADRGINGFYFGFIFYDRVLTTIERNNLYNNYIAPRYGL